jgi:hypothetical protein
MGFQEYAITMNVYPKRVDKVIEREEQHIQRLQIDALSERKQSLVTDLAAKQEKVNELQQGKVIPLTCLYVVRIWHRDPDMLAARAASLKNAFISMGGAVIHHATIQENARQLFYQTWPGWTFGSYRVFDLAAEDSYLADMLPWSATFTGHLDGAEAIYNGARGNLVGVRIRLGNTPQHSVYALFGVYKIWVCLKRSVSRGNQLPERSCILCQTFKTALSHMRNLCTLMYFKARILCQFCISTSLVVRATG